MDPVTLASNTILVLSPYFAKGAEEFAKSAGKDVYEQMKKLKAWLWQKISKSNDAKLKSTTNLFASDPDTFKEPMKKLLSDYLAKNPRQASELSQLLDSLPKNQSGKYNVSISGGTVYGVNVGDNPTVTQNFGTTKDSS